MLKPDIVFDRTTEWAALADWRDGIAPFGVVSGRRRHGKSFLLRHMVEATGGFYHQAIQLDSKPALERFGRDFALALGFPAALRFDSWEAAIEATLSAAKGPVVLDEFPYLQAGAPELASSIQAVIDRLRVRSDSGAGSGTGLIVCGSSLSIMSGVLAGQSPLRGRATLDLLVRPFDYRTAAAYWGAADSPEVAFVIDAVFGGGAGYRDLMRGRIPTDHNEIAEWLASGPLNPAHALFDEDDYLLREEPSITDRSHYLSLLQAIAEGNATSGGIASAVGRDARSIHYGLGSLERAGLIVRSDDALRENRPIYQLADPIVRFCRLVTRAEVTRFELGHWADALAARSGALSAGIYGPHFEHVSREFCRRFASHSTLGGSPTSVGSAVLADREQRAPMELDLVVLGDTQDGRRNVLAIGESKHTNEALGPAHLHRLERARDLIFVSRSRTHRATDCKLMLFSRAGFTRDLTANAATRRDVELIDFERLYAGS